MKKSLFAIAAVTAFAGAAQAQSSVTVYGIIDAGYVGTNARADGVKVQRSSFGQSNETTSRLGFRGTEDLGGGMAAFFTMELGITPQNANLSGGTAVDSLQRTSQNAGSAIDNRQAFIGLRSKGVGQFALGRQYTPVFNAGSVTSPGQYNNMVGDMVYAGGASGAFGSSNRSGNTNGLGFTNRSSNALTAQTDRFGGFVLSAMYAMNNQDTTQTASAGGTVNYSMWGVGGDFRWQKLIVTAAYQAFDTNYTNNVATTAAGIINPGAASTSGVPIAAGTIFAAGQTKDNQTLAGAVYDFGIVKTYAQWVNRKMTNASGQETLNRNAQQIGVRGNITPKIEPWASLGSGSIKAAAGEETANFTGWQLGSNYILSKRTNLYAIYGQTQTSSTTQAKQGFGASQYSIGARHTF